MVWDFAEGNPFARSGGELLDVRRMQSRRSLRLVTGDAQLACAARQTLRTQNVSVRKLISTDPPYYDNIGYADLSDFFYVWLRRSLKTVFPDLFATLAVPKAEELVATPYRHGGKEKAEAFFLDGMTQAMHASPSRRTRLSGHHLLCFQAVRERERTEPPAPAGRPSSMQ